MLLFLSPCPRTEFIQPSRGINLELTPDLSRGFIVQVMMCSQHCCIPMIIYHARTQTVQKLKLKELKEALYMYIFLFCAVFMHLLTSYTFLCPVWTRHSLSRLVLHLYAKQIHKWLSLAAPCLASCYRSFKVVLMTSYCLHSPPNTTTAALSRHLLGFWWKGCILLISLLFSCL